MPNISSDSGALNAIKQLETAVWYLNKDPKFETEKPYYSNIPFDHPDAKQTNLESSPFNVQVTDIRGDEHRYNLDSPGFQILKKELSIEYDKFADSAWIQETYYPIVENWLREAIGESDLERIYIYDHTVRRRDPNIPLASRGSEGALQPVPAAHVDHSHNSGPTRVRAHLSEVEAEELMKNRFQIINVWQPLFGPIQDWPLAVCDPNSVALGDLVPTDLIYPHYFGEIYSLYGNPQHQWYFLKDQMPGEILLLKCYDSETSSNTRFVPHCGINNPQAPADARPRESIEFRAMVFYKAK
ncbi:MAG: hypothetical protein Q9214_003615 [Letrouitia sp. 1 TL-2023]